MVSGPLTCKNAGKISVFPRFSTIYSVGSGMSILTVNLDWTLHPPSELDWNFLPISSLSVFIFPRRKEPNVEIPRHLDTG